MRYAILFFAVLAVVCLSGVAVRSAEAKTPAYIITGGELGPYAYHFFLGPGEESTLVDASGALAPQPTPSLSYELYSSWGNFAVAEQIANGGPELQYYPEAGLLHRKFDGAWLRLSNSGERTLGKALAEALAKKEAGELEAGPIRADFRVRHLAEATYTFSAWSEDFRPRDFSSFGEPWLDGPSLGRLSGLRAENFVMEELVGTLGGTPTTSPPAVAEVAISYTASDPETQTGYGGLLGFYSPPEGGQRGRFWHDGYFYDRNTPYYETTAGFDAAMAAATAGVSGQSKPTRGGDAAPIGAVVAIGAAAGVAALMGSLALLRRRARRSVIAPGTERSSGRAE